MPFQTRGSDRVGTLSPCPAAYPSPSSQQKRSTGAVEIVSKLMAKNAENRYQSAIGLKYDLETCLQQWQETGNIASFKLGAARFVRSLYHPRKVVRSEKAEVFSLLEALSVAAFDGVREQPK